MVGGNSSLIITDGTQDRTSVGEDEDDGSGSGSGSASGGGASGSGSASGDGVLFTVLALLQVSVEEGGIQCSDAGQYECVAGLNPEAGAVRTIRVNITVIGEDC